MRVEYKHNAFLIFLLISVSTLLFSVHLLIFQDLKHLFYYLLHDIAFLPVEVLIVTLILHRVLETRERRQKKKKLNMVIGSFYSEVGNDLLSKLSRISSTWDSVRGLLEINGQWDQRQFRQIAAQTGAMRHQLTASNGTLKELKSLLVGKREYLLALLENPSLLEHDSFTDALWAVFHVVEELKYRSMLDKTGDKDRGHLELDLQRAYARLVQEWLMYMSHLKQDYPYLFSLAIRINPFMESQQAEIT